MNIEPKYMAVGVVGLVVLVWYVASLQGQPESEVTQPRADYLTRSVERYLEKQEQTAGGGLLGGGRTGESSSGYRDGTPSSFNQHYYGGAAPATPTQQVPVTQGDGYYPPPALTQPVPSKEGVPQGNLTSDGIQLAFQGMYVFRVDADGKQRPMPDGVYVLQSGVRLIVRDGKKIILNN
jgi:hypothetical protein